MLFLFAILFCSAIAAGLLADNFVTENILATSGLVLAIFLIIPFEKWLVYREAHSRHPVLPPVLLILAVFAVTFAMMAHQLGKSPSAIASGKNVNACGYTHDFTDYGSRDLEKLIQEKYSKSEGIPVARIDLRDYHEVFLLSENEITTYEFAEQNKKTFTLEHENLCIELPIIHLTLIVGRKRCLPMHPKAVCLMGSDYLRMETATRPGE